MKKKLVVLTGAGISADSGVATFRGSDGLWEGHDIMEVASPIGFHKNPALVLDFYNQRRRQVTEVDPNSGHKALVDLEEYFDVTIVTQNIDDLHERAGSSQVIHLHGEILKARSSINADMVLDWKEDIVEGDMAADGSQLRPHIVWFGEAVPMMEPAAERTSRADILLIVGTSMQVYPAAGLKELAPSNCTIYGLDPQEPIWSGRAPDVFIQEGAAKGLPDLVKEIIQKHG